MKRTFDVIVAGLGFVITMPIVAIAAIAVLLDTGRPVLFEHQRVGRNGKPFRVLKFRSMHTDSQGAEVTTAGEDRITRVGRVLRKSKIDELPQLVNILRGDMSLVGPRPEVDRFVRMFPDQFERLLCERPGLTDPASIRFRDEEGILAEQEDPEAYYVSTILPQKLDLSLSYLETRSLKTDLRVIADTAKTVAGRE